MELNFIYKAFEMVRWGYIVSEMFSLIKEENFTIATNKKLAEAEGCSLVVLGLKPQSSTQSKTIWATTTQELASYKLPPPN